LIFLNFVFLFSGGTVEQIVLLRQLGVIIPLCALLEAKEDSKTISVVLDSLANILGASEKMGELEKVSLYVEDCGGLDRIEDLQSHENNEIYHKALAILEQYFSNDVSEPFLWLFKILLR
jgi:importin subunit alpha-2